MLRKIYLLLFILLIHSASLSAQNSLPIFSINGQEVSAGDFFRDCGHKLSPNDTTGLYTALQQYADSRVMAAEAHHLRLDTTAQFRAAMQYSKSRQLQRHITQSPLSQKALNDIFSHSQYQYGVSYIRIDILRNSHGDTSAAYGKAMRAIDRINGGKDFQTVARQMSDAPDSKINSGYLGYVSPIDMKTGMEAAQYIYAHYGDGDKLSRPIRSGNSYYVLRLSGRRDAIDSVEVSPIMIRKRLTRKYNDSIRSLMETLRDRLAAGNDFQAIQMEYSDIKFSEKLSLHEAYAKYSTHLLDTQDGTTPLLETDDYLLIARIGRKTALRIDDGYRTRLIDQLPGTESYRQAYGSFLDSIRGISQYSPKGNLNPICNMMPDSSIFEAKWNPGDLRHHSQVLFTFGGKSYTYADFADYIYRTQYPTGYSKIPEYVQMRYQDYLREIAIDEAYAFLAKSSPEFQTSTEKDRIEILGGFLAHTREYPKNTADTLEVLRYYHEKCNKLKTCHTLAIKLYSYEPSNRKKAVRYAEMAQQGMSGIDYTILMPKLNDTLSMGSHPIADKIIDSYDSGQRSGDNKLVFLDETCNIAIASVYKTPEELSRTEIFSIISPKYLRENRRKYIEVLRRKHSLSISANAYADLAKAINK